MHIPCATTQHALNHFPASLKAPPAFDPSFQRLNSTPSARSADDGGETSCGRSEAPRKEGVYEVQAGDSLAVIALRHGMRKETLLRLNRLLTPEVYPGQQLMVFDPAELSPEEVEAREAARRLRTVARRGGCTAGEAAYYLDAGGGDVGRALALRAEDAAWEVAVTCQHAEQTAEKMAIASAVGMRVAIARANVRRTLDASA